MHTVSSKVFLLLIVAAIALPSYAYDFWSQDPLQHKTRTIKPAANKVVEEELKKPVEKPPVDSVTVKPLKAETIEKEEEEVTVEPESPFIDEVKDEVVKPEPKVEEEPVPDDVPVPEDEGEAKLSGALPEPQIEEPVVKKDPHVKIIIHTSKSCRYCQSLLEQAKKLEDKYEIEVQEHSGTFYTSYRMYIYTFPFTEFVYDGRVTLYRYGYMDVKSMEYIISTLR